MFEAKCSVINCDSPSFLPACCENVKHESFSKAEQHDNMTYDMNI